MESNNSTKLFAVLSYFSIVGWIISYVFRDKEDVVVKHHLNQGLSLILVEVVLGIISKFGGIFAFISWIGGIAVLVFAIIGIVRALQLSTEPLPLIGDIRLVK